MIRRLNSFIIRNLLKFVRTKDNYILFESAEHHVFDNSFYLYKFLKNYRKLRLFYVVYNENQYHEALSKGIKRKYIFLILDRINIHTTKNIFYILKWRMVLKKCKVCFYSYRNFYKEFKIPVYSEQVLINLRHGQFPLKNVTKYYEGLCFSKPNNVFFRVGTQESLELLTDDLKNLNCKWFASPMPRIDSIFEDKFAEFCNLIKINKNEYKNYKYVLCLTTFRGCAEGSYFGTQFPIQIQGPDYSKLDKFLNENRVKLLIKVHHDNIISKDDQLYNSQNIIVLDDTDLERYNLFVDNLFRYTHALLTDYSSAFYDYLYVDKPIGFILTDFDKYSKDRGFTLDLNNYLCGEKISSLAELFNFLNCVVTGDDKYKTERQTKFKLFNGEFKQSYSEDIAKLFINSKYLT